MTRQDDGLAFVLKYENVAWYEDGKVKILDRRIYPVRTEFVVCDTYKKVAQAITDMVTQSGGPYTAAAMGMALAAFEAKNISEEKDYMKFMQDAAYALSHARPTTSAKMVSIVNNMLDYLQTELKKNTSLNDIPEKLAEKAIERSNDNYSRYSDVARFLADKIPDGGTVMTQCFAETIIGTLLRECRKRGNNIKMICAETRPFYQGARLTASVSADMGFDTTVICDNMPAYTMKEKKVDIFTSAADVITMDGYVVNKVGTFQMALAARYWGIPYFATGFPNQKHPTISTVKIEERDPQAVLCSLEDGIHTLQGVKGYYPAFDITPPKLCDGIVTDKGILSPFNLSSYFD